jgi:hypothetical protein
MAFDITTARPVGSTQQSPQQPVKRFDINTAKPVQAKKPVAPKKQEAPQAQGSILNPLAQGASFGWGDEAAAGALVSYGVLSGEIPENQAETAYNAILEGINTERQAYASQNPVKSIGAEAASAMTVGLPRIVQSLAQKGLVSAGMVAGAEGALYGAGTGGEGYEKGEEIALGVKSPVDVSGRVTEGAKTAALSVPLGVGGAWVAQGLSNIGKKVTDVAERRKLVREGSLSPETAGYVLKDPTQKILKEVSPTGNVIDDTLAQITQRPQGVKEVITEFSPFKPSVIESQSAKKAIYQKVPPTIITGIREANRPTRNAMEKITKIHYAKVNNKTTVDPFMVVGDEFNKRLGTVQKKHNDAIILQSKARKELAGIKGEQLSPIVDDVAESFTKNFEDNLITLDDAGNLDFSYVKSASPLAKPANRTALNKVWKDFRNAKTADDLYQLRRNIDKMVKYEKGGLRGGFDDDTTKILKDVRSQIRDSLNKSSSDYAEANRIMSQNFSAFEKLESSMPKLKKYDLENPEDFKTAVTYIGQQLRSMDSNTTTAAELNQAVELFDDLSKQYGSEYPVDVKQLSRYLSEVKLRLGEGKPAAFQAKVEAATRRGTSPVDAKGMIRQKMEDILNPVKGISDDEAYEAILENINEMNKRELK